MSNDVHDPILTALASARPADDHDDSSTGPAAHALLDRIVAPTVAGEPRRRRSRRVRITAGALSAAAAIVVAVVAVNTITVDGGHVVIHQQSAAADVTAIARASAAAFSSGRAEMTFDAHDGSTLAERGTAQIAFSGKNLDVAMQFAAEKGQRGYDVHNLTVGGQYYLLDGAPGAKKWYHETAAGADASDIFDLDPRSLLGVLQPSAGFVVVDSASTPTGTVRHLRATHLGGLPSLHLVLGPVSGPDVTSLDVWVGSDNTVRRLTLTAKHTETPAPACFTQGGVKQCLTPGGTLSKVGDKIVITPAPKTGTTAVVVLTTTASFAVDFTDIGAPISITAPPHAIPIAGKG